MSNTETTDRFLQDGGVELGLASCTSDLTIALLYATKKLPGPVKHQRRANKALILRIEIESFMSMGIDVAFLSCFQREKEKLYPPLTLFLPVSKPEKIEYNGVQYEIVTVHPDFPN